MDVEIPTLDLRYAELRTQNADRERRLIASMAEIGQQIPVVVVRVEDRDVLLDGYKRVRALHRLGHDLVRATPWDLGELDALLLERMMRSRDATTALEEGWLLRELVARFGLSREELGRRFDRTPSWVSRRLGLVSDLPPKVQGHVRSGAIGAHAAMRYLVPLARANERDCETLCASVAPLRPTSRELGVLYAAYSAGNAKTRALVVAEPALALRAREAVGHATTTPAELLIEDLRLVAAVAHRACVRLRKGALDGATERERELVHSTRVDVCAEVKLLAERLEQEGGRDAG